MHPTPLAKHFENADATIERYALDNGVIEMVGNFDHPDIEYSAVRKSCGMIDFPTRGMIVVRGSDRVAFLNRMITQELKGVVNRSVNSFWLNRKGRIDADLRVTVVEGEVLGSGKEGAVLLDMDVLAVKTTSAGLGAYVIADDVTLEDVTDCVHMIGLYGPGSGAVLKRFSKQIAGVKRVEDLAVNEVTRVEIGGVEVLVDRTDEYGVLAFRAIVGVGRDASQKSGASPATTAQVIGVYEALLGAVHTQVDGHVGPNARPMLRPIGWHALNVARVEAGTPLFYIDFGPENLPAEAGKFTLADRVSFKKGCYLGQEIVARMNALGAPKQCVVSMKIGGRPETIEEQEVASSMQPGRGAPVFAMKVDSQNQSQMPDVEAGAIGAITSSTTAPLLGGQVVAMGVVKFKFASDGTKVFVGLDGGRFAAGVIGG